MSEAHRIAQAFTHISLIHPRTGVRACSPGQAKRSPGKVMINIAPLKGVRAAFAGYRRNGIEVYATDVAKLCLL